MNDYAEQMSSYVAPPKVEDVPAENVNVWDYMSHIGLVDS